MDNQYIEIKLRRCKLYLSEAEIISLLAHDENLWKDALKRGKAISRAMGAEERRKSNGKGYKLSLPQS